jgi:hypothetical protein
MSPVDSRLGGVGTDDPGVVALPKRYDVKGAAAVLGVSPATVAREIGAGRLACYRLGPGAKKIQVGEQHLAGYLACRETKAPSGSATTSSASAPTATNGAPAGTTHVLDRRSAVASARTTFAPRKSNSPASSPAMRTSAIPTRAS